jgi:hypothetical protein
MPATLKPHDATMVAAQAQLREAWMREWPAALGAWSRFVKLSPPRFLDIPEALSLEGMSGSFAAIRLHDHAIMIDTALACSMHLEEFGREILAHEIGHHVFAPGDVHDNARLLARIRRGLPSQEAQAPMISNLYTDLLINDRLHRQANLNMAAVYTRLDERHQAAAPPTARPAARKGKANREPAEASTSSRLWTLYMRIYEIAWSLPTASLAHGEISPALDVDAGLGARLIRSYAGDWMRGAGRFAMLCLPYLIEDAEKQKANAAGIWLDTRGAGSGGMPDGLVEIDPDEMDGAIHPAEDPLISGIGASKPAKSASTSAGEGAPREVEKNAGATGQAREPFEYGEILRAAGIEMSGHDIAVRYYRERARPHLVRFPQKRTPSRSEPLIEGVTPWESGEPLDSIDWLQTLVRSPHVIPGLTTVQRAWGDQPAREEQAEPIDLDLYVDCSGSMPNPQEQTSFTTLAGAIILLSALRAGSRVKATLWSGKNDFQTNGEFTRDETAVLRILTGYIGGATAFPIHLLRETFQPRTLKDRAVHILILSDDGVTTLFDNDEQGNSGWTVSQMAMSRARGGGTMALNLWTNVEANAQLVRAQGEGWAVHRVGEWDELLAFARDFSRRNYER